MSEISNDVKTYEDEIDSGAICCYMEKQVYYIESGFDCSFTGRFVQYVLVTPVYHTKLK